MIVYEQAEIELPSYQFAGTLTYSGKFDNSGAINYISLTDVNEVEIKLTNLANYCSSLEDNPTAQSWTLFYGPPAEMDEGERLAGQWTIGWSPCSTFPGVGFGFAFSQCLF